MKKRKIIVIIAAAVVFIIAADVGVTFLWNFINMARKYGQAEPLVVIVWPMASDIQGFQRAKGAFPTSLQELAAFSGTTQCLALAAYPHEFTRGTNIVFRMMVNDMFGFKVDTNCAPNWIWPPPHGVLTLPGKLSATFKGSP
jgi:hypothetical protein